jgi:hypothetical protein
MVEYTSPKSGTGKGTGKSWWQVWTGQKTTSVILICKIEALRIQANEVGSYIPTLLLLLYRCETTLGKQVVTKEWINTKSYLFTCFLYIPHRK